MIPKDLTKDIKIRLQIIKGQLDGLINMLDQDQDLEKILTQFKAAQRGFNLSCAEKVGIFYTNLPQQRKMRIYVKYNNHL